jgi:hypothetical protein
MATQTRGERNNNPGNIERVKANPWQGQLSDADYAKTSEALKNGGRFDVFSAVEYGIRALASLLVNYQDKHGLRTIRGIAGRWAPSSENNTGAYVAHVAALSGFGPDALLDLHSHDHLAPLVKAIITHENGRCLYSDAVIDDGLLRAGVKGIDAKVVSVAADAKRARTTKAAVGGASALGLIEVARQVTPVVQSVGELPLWLGISVGVIALAVAGYILLVRKA